MTELPDRLLRDALHDAASTLPPAVCADADALAAWADGTMPDATRAAFDAHAAGCARCQALVAAMVRIEPPPIEPASWWRSPGAWLLPLATATAALVIIVKLVELERPSPPATVARSEPAAADRQVPQPGGPAQPGLRDAAREAPAARQRERSP